MTVRKAVEALESLHHRIGDAEQDLRNALEEYFRVTGGASQAARKMGVAHSYLSDIRHGRRNISAAVLGKLRDL